MTKGGRDRQQRLILAKPCLHLRQIGLHPAARFGPAGMVAADRGAQAGHFGIEPVAGAAGGGDIACARQRPQHRAVCGLERAHLVLQRPDPLAKRRISDQPFSDEPVGLRDLRPR